MKTNYIYIVNEFTEAGSLWMAWIEGNWPVEGDRGVYGKLLSLKIAIGVGIKLEVVETSRYS
jgi:hypothetical protein